MTPRKRNSSHGPTTSSIPTIITGMIEGFSSATCAPWFGAGSVTKPVTTVRVMNTAPIATNGPTTAITASSGLGQRIPRYATMSSVSRPRHRRYARPRPTNATI